MAFLAVVVVGILADRLKLTSIVGLPAMMTGVFAHVGIDMLTECPHADSSGHGTVHCSTEADSLHRNAVASTFPGAGAIFVLWQTFALLRPVGAAVHPLGTVPGTEPHATDCPAR